MRAKALWAALAVAALSASALADPPRSAVIDERASYPEGPLFVDGALYVAEMGADRVSRYVGETKQTFFTREGCGPTALARYGDDFVVLCHIEHALAIIDADGALVRMIDRDVDNRALQDPNDVTADDRGGVYFSDPGIFSTRFAPHGALVYLDAEGVVRRVDAGLWYPNGVYFDRSEHALYVSETFRHRILRYPVLEDGALGEAALFAQIDFRRRPFGRYRDTYAERGPDGLERAPDGRLFVAIYGEGVVIALNREGRVVSWLQTPARYMTNIVFTPAGEAYTVGSSIHDRPPFTGEVRRWPQP